MPSELKNSKVVLKLKKEQKIINNLRSYLEKNTDGLNCETRDMMQTGKKILMLSWGLDKPYSVTEFTKDLRNEKNYKKLIPTFNLAQKTYFYFLLIGYFIENDFRYD